MEPNEISKGLKVGYAKVAMNEATDEDMEKINKLALAPLSKDEVFTFKVMAADNETDDRNFEPYNARAIQDLSKLYPGKTVIKDHKGSADNQVARVYDAEIKQYNKTTGAGEPKMELILKCYMVKTKSNEDLIAEIKAGIKKEVSTGSVPKKAVCNICGADNMKSYCPHWPGVEYDTKEGKKVCMLTLDGAKEAYELSFVAIPAQPRAGATKKKKTEIQTNKGAEVEAQTELAAIGSFIFIQKMKEDQ